MSSSSNNRIDAEDKNINLLLKEEKFFIDYFQREYRWEEKHIKQLVEDLTTTFLKSYIPGHERTEVENYQNYYLGQVIFSVNSTDGKKSIIDGQQRITSITLFLIYLNHLQNGTTKRVSISELIFSEKFGQKSFNMTDELRRPCLKSLLDHGVYETKENDDETVKNMVKRYENISESFPEELKQEALPYFIDWLIRSVVIVEIIAYSDENAYIIFESMNDRGLNLTPTEMLKGYVLSKIKEPSQRIEINYIWKKEIQKLHSKYDETTDQSFFQAWFRGKYADSIRPGKVGSENKDFELIGSKFHSWFKDNHEVLLKLKESKDFYEYFKKEFPFFVRWYLVIKDARAEYDEAMRHLYYINNWGIAESLQEPLLISSISIEDDEAKIKMKLNYVARYIETFTVRRSVNFKNFAHASIKYTMFNVIKKIRNKDVTVLATNLSKEINNIPQEWNGISSFGLHGQNRRFVKHLLSRISGHIDELVGKSTNYVNYYNPEGKQFEIEHIWANKFEDHEDEFDQKNEFEISRNLIGGLILLPKGTNQSFGSNKYECKVQHYIKENTYAQTLHWRYYEKNPNFSDSSVIKELGFKSHSDFKVQDIKERTELVQRICEQLWSISYFESIH